MKHLLPAALIGLLFAFPGYGQVITDVPPNQPNTRFMDDPSVISMRPGLTLAGFSSDGSNGLGLQQLLNAAFESTGSPEYAVVSKILSKANDPINPDPEFDQIERTTNVLQYMAFEALASFVLEQNGITAEESDQTYSINIREHADVMEDFTTTLMSLADNNKLVRKQPGDEPFGDYLDALRSYNNMARALDLYLAIENAYQYFLTGETSPELLLTEHEKTGLMNRFRTDINILYNDGVTKIYNVSGTSITVSEDKLEAGNRPLKGYLSVGYSSMGIQTDDETEKERFDSYTSTAIARASESVEENERDNYWMYQTGNGNRYWAEGPYYFDLVLKDALIFWHAIRIQDDLEPSFDPFFNNWFLNPVRWLADLSTPDGSTPPFDDGNKRPIQSSILLRWSGEYGDEEIGRSFKTIFDAVNQSHAVENLEDQYYLLEAAIPFAEEPGTERESLTDTTGQQLVVRHTDTSGKNHYIVLNGEKNGAIISGEGHEQPDQLQLLYYINENSFLVDPGYDTGNPQVNSTWNGYRFNNTMQYDAVDIRTNMAFVVSQNEGGIESPYVSFIELRKVSTHNKAELNHEVLAPQVDMMAGRVQLVYQNPLPATANYNRTVLLIKSEDPYLIDINDAEVETGRNDFVMRYHGNSDQQGNQNDWFFWDTSGQPFASSSDRLFLYTIPLIGSYTEENDMFDIQEYENRGPDDEKQPYPIVRKSYYSNEETDRFTTASILNIRESAPAAEPEFFRNMQNLSYLTHQIDNNTVDLFVFSQDSLETKRTLSIDSGVLAGLDFSISQHSTIGFSRLKKSSDNWSQDSDYSVNMNLVSAPDAPTNLTVELENRASGPAAVLNWNAPGEGDIDHYQVWRQIRAVEDLSEEPASQIATTSSTQFADLSITDFPVGEYEFRWFVRAVNSDSLESEPSNTTDWIRLDETTKPTEFDLFDPYPNPARQEVSFKYQLPEQARVTLEIFDIMGRRISTLLQEEQEGTVYTETWQPDGVASGIYVIRMTAESTSGQKFKKSVLVSVVK